MAIARNRNGYSLVELLVATVLFTLIAGTVFSLLLSAQLRYRGESDVTTAFQQANVAIDQIVRDVHSAGYPPPSSFALGVSQASPQLVALPFAWSLSNGYPNAPCAVSGSCGSVPGDYDLILETDIGDAKGVQWIRYSLDGTTLKRAIAPKVAFKDPVNETTGALVPYLDNVLNRSTSTPIFSYFGDSAAPSPLSTSYIQNVNIKLIVQSAERDPQTQQFRTITLTGQAMRFNPHD
jgi:type II secretory pathway pseudopilin PulG